MKSKNIYLKPFLVLFGILLSNKLMSFGDVTITMTNNSQSTLSYNCGNFSHPGSLKKLTPHTSHTDEFKYSVFGGDPSAQSFTCTLHVDKYSPERGFHGLDNDFLTIVDHENFYNLSITILKSYIKSFDEKLCFDYRYESFFGDVSGSGTTCLYPLSDDGVPVT